MLAMGRVGTSGLTHSGDNGAPRPEAVLIFCPNMAVGLR